MNKFLKGGFVVAATAALALAACGDDPVENNNSNNQSNVSTNNATSNNSTSNNSTTNNTTTSTSNNGTTGSNNTTMEEPPPPGCDDPTPPARCAETPEGFAWGTASVINTFAIEGEGSDPVCCFDYNGDDEIDNALGVLLAGAGFKADINDSIADGINDGSITIVLEHDGLAALEDGTFNINFWLGEWGNDMDGMPITMLDPAGSNPILIDPASIDTGTQPLAYIPDATLAGTAVEAGPGVFQLALELLGTPLVLRVSAARVEADVDLANSSIDGGVALTNAKLGGYVKTEDIINAINLFASTCTCLGIGQDPLITPEGVCNANADATQCETDGEDTCAQIASNCTLLSVVPTLADIDADGDGEFDAVSIGATFTAAGATIQGVAEAQ